ncbi:MAG TPA: hypothetical protein VFW75_12125 [Acetobacteraceae bacterium]|nr:hypothetical protein [Acetobacteraceae bacterium]
MTRFDHSGWFDDGDEEADRQTASLGAVAITLLLIVIGLFLVRELHAKAVLEDCLLTGRTNCVVLAVP